MPLSLTPALLSENVLENLECEFCNELGPGPVYHCLCGDLFCATCYSKESPPCSKCDKKSFRECQALSSLMNNYSMQCPNRNDGCTLFITVDEYSNHMKVCEFAKLVCPICGKLENSPDLLGDHLLTHRPLELNYEIPENLFARDSFKLGPLLIQEREHKHFYVLIVSEDGLILHHLRSGRPKTYEMYVNLGPEHTWKSCSRTTEFKEPAREDEFKMTLPEVVFREKPTNVSLLLHDSSSWH